MRYLVPALLAALILAPVASAGAPYRFASRAKLERAAAVQFRSLAHRKLGGRFIVRSIGCAKGGVGRAYCAVVATSSRGGTQPYEFALLCPSDSGIGCTGRIDAWTAR